MRETTADTGLRIGDVAAGAGVTVQTVRYYGERRLVMPAQRTAGGYRLYAPESVRLVRFIKRAQELGFALDEIADLLRLRKGATESRGSVRALAEAKVADMDARLRDLAAMRDGLRTLIEACACGADFASVSRPCPILGALDGDTALGVAKNSRASGRRKRSEAATHDATHTK